MYIGGVGTTWLQKVHGGWEIGGGVILNKNIKTIHRILYVLFHVGDTLYECNAFNTIYVGDIGDTVLFL